MAQKQPAPKSAGTKDAGDSQLAGSGDIFDVKRIRRLVELMNEHDLAEVDLRQADQRIRIRKGGEPIVTSAPPRSAAAPAAAPAAGGESSGGAAKSDEGLAMIKSPMIGTFFASSSPESPPFVKVGDHVGPTTTVCIIEAMKVFNEIPAEISGQIVALLVENGEPVEFGQPLFKVDPRK
jgi:acetyl-CoA carboxylase biotin carboxyl carrier protein